MKTSKMEYEVVQQHTTYSYPPMAPDHMQVVLKP